jgi:hypothetical protein
MTFAITLIKCAAGKRENALGILLDLKELYEFEKDYIKIHECYISFGWPDFVLFLEGKNVELLKKTIVDIRDKVSSGDGGDLETSTIICTTKKDMERAIKDSGIIQGN